MSNLSDGTCRECDMCIDCTPTAVSSVHSSQRGMCGLPEARTDRRLYKTSRNRVDSTEPLWLIERWGTVYQRRTRGRRRCRATHTATFLQDTKGMEIPTTI